MVAHVICNKGKKISLKLDCCAYSFVESSLNKLFIFIFYYFLPTTILFCMEYRNNQSMPSQNMPYWPLKCSQVRSFGKQKTQEKHDTTFPFSFPKQTKLSCEDTSPNRRWRTKWSRVMVTNRPVICV